MNVVKQTTLELRPRIVANEAIKKRRKKLRD